MMLFPKKVVGYVLPLYLPTNYGSSATNHNHPEVLWKSPSKSRKNLSAWPWEWIGRANQPATANHVLPSTYVYIIYIYIINICVCDTDTYIAMIYSRQNPLHLSSCYQLSFFFGVGAILWVSSVLFGGHIALQFCAHLWQKLNHFDRDSYVFV